MIKMSQKIIKVTGLIFFFNIPLYSIDISTASHAVNIAGKQRMYTQRMLKDYAMIGMNNQFGKPSEDLKKIINAFEDHLDALFVYTKNKETKQSLEEIKSLWSSLSLTLSSKPSKDKVAKLQQDLEALLKASDTATKLFAKDSSKVSAKIVDLAGRQRMLSQRMASLYMLQDWGIDDPEFKIKLDEAMKLFKTSLATLNEAKVNTEEIKKRLAKVKRSFMFFEMMAKSHSKYIPSLIYKKSNEMLDNMNTVTENYVTLETK